MAPLVLCSTRVVLPGGERPASIHVENGVIVRIGDRDEIGPSAAVRDFGDLVISPGVVDTHVHVNEPGRTEWEGFDTATRAAAAGGVTTIVDMPLNSIPATTTVAALEAKRAAARGRCHVDVGFWGGVVPGNAAELEGLVDAGVRGFKCFLVPSGVDEFPAVDEPDLREALPIIARRDVPLLVHAELPERIRSAASLQRSAHGGARAFQASDYTSYLATRPQEAEVEAIRLIVRLAQEFGARMHIVHVAAAEALDVIERAKADGVRLTAETCPHYLTFAAEEIPDGATEFKCAPPIREARHRAALAAALDTGVLDLVATDHSPAPPALKCPGDFLRAWGGIASLQLSLSAVWSRVANHAAPARLQLARWLSERPAGLAGLTGVKGRIAEGLSADMVVWNPDAEFTVDAARLQHRHTLTPYSGRRLRGRVAATFVAGACVWDADAGGLVNQGAGRLL